MFKHILVPLDGSATAEVVLPAATYLARTLDARVTLIHVIESDAAPSVHGERHLTRRKEAESYLSEIGQRFFPDRPVTAHVHSAPIKDVARGIVLHEAELAPDLVILCTHGHGGLRGLLFGRIAQQVAASGNLPVLLIQPEFQVAGRTYACKRVLVPSDAADGHSQGLAIALDLARTVGAQLELLTVVPTFDALTGRQAATRRFSPGATHALLEMEATDLKNRLNSQKECCRAANVSAVTHLERGDPVRIIAETAESLDVDLIVVGTHGKAGTRAFWNGSVGARILLQTSRPVLLVPIRPS